MKRIAGLIGGIIGAFRNRGTRVVYVREDANEEDYATLNAALAANETNIEIRGKCGRPHVIIQATRNTVRKRAGKKEDALWKDRGAGIVKTLW